MTIREFVKKSIEYDHYRKHGTWGKYTVYHVWNKEWEGAKIGFPHFALVDGENIRIATLLYYGMDQTFYQSNDTNTFFPTAIIP